MNGDLSTESLHSFDGMSEFKKLDLSGFRDGRKAKHFRLGINDFGPRASERLGKINYFFLLITVFLGSMKPKKMKKSARVYYSELYSLVAEVHLIVNLALVTALHAKGEYDKTILITVGN